MNTTTATPDNDDHHHDGDAMAVLHSEAKAVAQCFGVKDCEAVAAALVDRIAMRLGGAHIYVPKRSTKSRAQVRAEIRAKFNGLNQTQLASEYGISTRHIRRLLK